MKRYPLLPLIEAGAAIAGLQVCPEPRSNCRGCRMKVHYWTAFLAHDLGLERSRVQHWHRRGVTDRNADESACKLGLHPMLVWPELWFADLDVDLGFETEQLVLRVAV